MIKACVFDLDGTLLDTLFALSDTMSRVMRELGFKEIDIEHTKKFVGDGYENFVEKSLIYVGDKELKNKEEACRRYIEIFKENSLNGVRLYEGIDMVLDILKQKGIKLAVLSNKPQNRVEDNIYHFFGKDLFDKVYGEREGIKRKPDPTALAMLLDELGVENHECLYFGDTDTDMKTGKAAGVLTVGVLWGFRDEEELSFYMPEHIISNPRRILDLI